MIVPWLIQGPLGVPRRHAIMSEGYDGSTYLAIPFIGMIALGQRSFVDLQPNRHRVLAAIRRGGARSVALPSQLLSGADAAEVAHFVPRSAGR